MWDGDRKEHKDPHDRKADANNKEGWSQMPGMASMIWWHFSSLWKAEQGSDTEPAGRSSQLQTDLGPYHRNSKEAGMVTREQSHGAEQGWETL